MSDSSGGNAASSTPEPLPLTPVLALVGRPNVGKSTLFNKLTRSNDALVADFPGLTRDRQYGDGKVGGFAYIVVDTGGLSGEDETLDAAMAEQTHLAIDEADLVIFMVDGRAGLTPADETIAATLRRLDKRVLLCINKIDGVGEDRAQLDFFSLGFDAGMPIAASHNRGVQSLMQLAREQLGIDAAEQDTRSRRKRRKDAAASATDDEGPAAAPVPETIRIAFIGRPNVGKSTLVNRLLGEDRVIAYDKPGTTRDAVAIPFQRGGKTYQLVDTAGIRRRGKVRETIEKFSIVKTLQAIDDCHVAVMLVDASEGLTDQDLSLLGYIIDKGRALVVAMNKWDALDTGQREERRAMLERRVEFLKFTRIHFISALQGSGVNDLFKSINRAHASAFVDLSTSRLTRLLEAAVAQHPPPMVNGRRIKLRYAHQGGRNPPVIVVHGNQVGKVPGSYQRYLSNALLKSLKLFGTPLRVEFRQGDNPFANRGRRSQRGQQRSR